MNERELIVYATPTGALADQCATYFARAEELGGTTAQTYPPHCTLTGFFRRRPDRVPAIVDCVTEHIASTAHPPQGAVTVVGLRQLDDWIGLELDSSWLIDWTSRLAEHFRFNGAPPIYIDTWPEKWSKYHHLFEDGLKFAGLALWTSYNLALAITVGRRYTTTESDED